jgi:hypothetical protein
VPELVEKAVPGKVSYRITHYGDYVELFHSVSVSRGSGGFKIYYLVPILV